MDIQPFKTINFLKLVDQIALGALCIYPTETCYGIGCDVKNHKAVEKIFEIKGRSKEKPCILLFRDMSMLSKYVVIPKNFEKIFLKYWPGPLTVLLEVLEKSNISPLLVPETRKISCRISSHPFIQRLFEYCDVPLLSTSANFSGDPNIYTSKEILEKFSSKKLSPDIFVDAGDLALNPPSTIIEIKDGQVEILRQGSIRFD
jgi:L-threonylcarbamoyladenylate synthase